MDNKKTNKKLKDIQYYLSKIFRTSASDISINCLLSSNDIIDRIEFTINGTDYKITNKFV